jgi:hypothetical protein
MGQDLVVSAGADKVSYRSGEPVVITVEYRNNSEATCVLPSGTSVEWRDASGQPLGGVSGHGDCLGRCAPAAPGDAAAQTWCWDQRAKGCWCRLAPTSRPSSPAGSVDPARRTSS